MDYWIDCINTAMRQLRAMSLHWCDMTLANRKLEVHIFTFLSPGNIGRHGTVMNRCQPVIDLSEAFTWLLAIARGMTFALFWFHCFSLVWA